MKQVGIIHSRLPAYLFPKTQINTQDACRLGKAISSIMKLTTHSYVLPVSGSRIP